MRAQVGCHDQHGVAEVGAATLCIGETTLFKNLKQRVEHVWVSLFDFVKQHNRERLATNGLCELTAFFVAHVSRRRANQAADRVLLHVFAHVESNQRIIITKQEVGKCFCELGLAHAGWAEEDERTAWTLWVFEARACATNALADSFDCIILRNDSLVQLGFHVEQLGRFFFGEFVHRNACPHAQHFGNCFFVYFVKQVNAACFYSSLFFETLFEQCTLLIAQTASFFEALFFNSLLFSFLHVIDLGFDFLQVRRRGHALDAQTAAGFIDEVDCLVWQVTVGDVAV